MISIGRNIPPDFKEGGADKTYDEIFELICRNIKIDISANRFIYFIDENYVMDTTKGYRYENLTPDYEKIVKYSLNEIQYADKEIDNEFCKSYNLVIKNLALLAQRIVEELKKNYPEKNTQIKYFESICVRPAEGFEEAIQRMLFINQIFWQMDHRLTGLGAWDFILEPYYKSDIENGLLTRDGALAIIGDLYQILHEHYEYKSNVLMGDTGQIFVLGRSDESGNYLYNDLTILFIEAMRMEHLSEPKCLLRVNKNTPKELVETALNAIVTGIGAPLFANDDVVIPCLTDFGIPIEDACQWTTSACWEPLIGGKSSSLNNMTVLNYLRPLDNLLHRERLENIKNFEELLEKYLIYLRRNLRAVKRVLSPIRFQYNPLLSVFLDDCRELKRDVSQGGARYHNVGITSVAMGNLINSLMYIKEYVFEKHIYDLYDIKRMVITDFEGYESLRDELREKHSYFGKDETYIMKLVNTITKCVSEEITEYRSYLDGKMKVGLSGSAYLDAAKNFGASFDGRSAGEPFIVHISNEDNEGYTEIVNFASNIEYTDNRFNGNVVDYMVSPDFIKSNWDKFVDFLMLSIKVGFFEMQMNVVSSQTLIKAKKHPEDFPELIVRVWGFSAYFKDLPEEYKDVLIERTQRNEMYVS